MDWLNDGINNLYVVIIRDIAYFHISVSYIEHYHFAEYIVWDVSGITLLYFKNNYKQSLHFI